MVSILSFRLFFISFNYWSLTPLTTWVVLALFELWLLELFSEFWLTLAFLSSLSSLSNILMFSSAFDSLSWSYFMLSSFFLSSLLRLEATSLILYPLLLYWLVFPEGSPKRLNFLFKSSISSLAPFTSLFIKLMSLMLSRMFDSFFSTLFVRFAKSLDSLALSEELSLTDATGSEMTCF